MFDRRIKICAARRAAVILLTAIVWATAASHGALAQNAPPRTPPAVVEATPPRSKIDDLLTALAEEWLKERSAAGPAAPVMQQNNISVLDYLSAGAGAIHDQIVTLSQAAPNLLDEFRQA